MAGKRIRKSTKPASELEAAKNGNGGESKINVGFPENFPPEMYIKIFKKIEDRKDLFPLRLVCQQWNKAALDVLEKFTTTKETEFQPVGNHRMLALPAPKLLVIVQPKKLALKAVTAKCKNIAKVHPTSTIFLTKAITVEFPKVDFTLQSLEGYFGNSGKTLKCVFLSFSCGINLRRDELSGLLVQMPNLKVLKLEYHRYYSPLSPETGASPLLPKLEKLTLASVCTWTAKWLLETVCGYIITLELIQTEYFTWDWDIEHYPNGLSKLRNLKLVNHSGFLDGIQMPNLTRLSITKTGMQKGLLRFISRFVNTLTELTLEWSLGYGWFMGVEPLRFPKLTKLCLIGEIEQSQSRLERLVLSSSFPKIKVLQLRTHFQLSEEDAFQHSNSCGHWDISPTLQAIEWVVTDQDKERTKYTFTRTA